MSSSRTDLFFFYKTVVRTLIQKERDLTHLYWVHPYGRQYKIGMSVLQNQHRLELAGVLRANYGMLHAARLRAFDDLVDVRLEFVVYQMTMRIYHVHGHPKH